MAVSSTSRRKPGLDAQIGRGVADEFLTGGDCEDAVSLLSSAHDHVHLQRTVVVARLKGAARCVMFLIGRLGEPGGLRHI
jgi:hypothetical protein